LQQAETATGQAAIASERWKTDSFAKRPTCLVTNEMEARLAAIYLLERTSRDTPGDDYWTVIETLTAFVRERSRYNEAERTSLDFEQRVSRRAYNLWQEAGQPEGERRARELWDQASALEKLGESPATDIATVLTVIGRRDERSRESERAKGWRLDFSGAVLKQALLSYAHLESAHLGGALLSYAHLERARLYGAHLEEADLRHAHLEGADLRGAYLLEADLRHAHLGGADLSDAAGLSERQLHDAHGDAATILPEGVARPAHWPPPANA
jgi:hypothetical protein